MRRCLIKDKGGVFELPMQYVVAVIVAALVILLIWAAAQNMNRDYELKEAIKEVKKIVNEAEIMYSTAEEGTNVTMNINLPSSVRKVTFGSSEKILAGRYYIIMDWGKRWGGLAENARFTGKEEDVAIIYGGTEKIMLHLIKNGEGEKYVEIIPL